jgi:hypothetical protein
MSPNFHQTKTALTCACRTLSPAQLHRTNVLPLERLSGFQISRDYPMSTYDNAIANRPKTSYLSLHIPEQSAPIR